MSRVRTQSDIVREDRLRRHEPVVNKLRIPGIDKLHTKEVEEIAETLAVVLKSQSMLREFRWVVGEYIELTSDPVEML